MPVFNEQKMKDQISKEINKLMYQKNNENITAVQDVIAKEINQKRNKIQGADNNGGLTSSHQMAAEAAVRKWKIHVIRKRREHLQLEDGAEIK